MARRLTFMVLVWVGVAAFAWLALGTPEEYGGYVVERGDLVVEVPVSGTLEAVDSVQLGPPSIPGMWNYKLASLAPEGMKVAPGAPVMRFDTTELERQLLDKQAERDSAAKELERRATELERQRRDAELQLAEARARLTRAELKADVPPEISKGNELRQTEIDLELARREVAHLERKLELEEERARAEMAALVEKRDRAAARVGEIQEHLRRMNVTAPREGTVIYVANWQGEKKKPGDQVWQMEKVIEIPDLTRMKARGEVDEADAGRLSVGQRVTFRLDAHPDLVFEGEVARIERTVQRQSPRNPLKVVKLDVALEETDTQRMRPGMRFRGVVEVERAEDVLLVPLAAVETTPDGPVVRRRGVWGGGVVPVEIGRRSGDLVEVVSGLSEGERLARWPEEGA